MFACSCGSRLILVGFRETAVVREEDESPNDRNDRSALRFYILPTF